METAEAVRETLTFVSPAFVLAIFTLLFVAYVATLIYKASGRSGAGDLLRQFMTPSFVIGMASLFLAGMGLWIAFYGPYPLTSDTQALILGAVVISALTDVRKFFMNSSAESERKNETINVQAKTIAHGTGNGHEQPKA